MDDEELLRYSRHILLDEIGVEGQEAIRAGSALVVGAGGLGSPVALFLASAGVGRIILVDNDQVDLTNLQRQIAHTVDRVGMAKVESSSRAMQGINPHVDVETIAERADRAMLERLLVDIDVVIDCCDNFATRQMINAACVAHSVPLVSGAAIRFDGQLAVFDSRNPQSACYACIFPPTNDFEETRCAVMGVFAPLVGIIGSMQAAEALKILSGAGAPMTNQLLMLDAKTMEFTRIRTMRDEKCPVCSTFEDHL